MSRLPTYCLLVETPSSRAKSAGLAAILSSGVDEVVFAAPEGIVALLGCCTLIVHTRPATGAIVGAMGRAYAKASAVYDRIAHLCLIERDSDLLPPGDVRAGIGALMKRFDTRLAAAAIVHEGEGFKATAVRSIVTGLCMAARTTHPTRVFSQLEPASEWTTAMLLAQNQAVASRLVSVMQELRAYQCSTGER
jgi:hypothetical protein